MRYGVLSEFLGFNRRKVRGASDVEMKQEGRKTFAIVVCRSGETGTAKERARIFYRMGAITMGKYAGGSVF